jgi:hypothetical protein
VFRYEDGTGDQASVEIGPNNNPISGDKTMTQEESIKNIMAAIDLVNMA